MADYKDYIVRYDIIADVTKAAEGLQSIANIAKEFEGPMNTLKTAITQVSQSVHQLKQNSQMTFAPKIDVGAFNNQLRAMVTQVRSAAAEMHTAIFQALSGNPAGTKAAQKGIGSALSGTRSVAAIKKDIEAYNKELDKLLGTPKKNKNGSVVRGRDGLIQMNKNGLAKATAQQQAIYQERLTNLEAQKRMYQQRIQQCKAELAVAEKLEKETAAQQAKAAKAQSKIVSAPTSKSTATSQPAKLTNVTPAVIREWKKAFGDAKSKALTVNIRGNATGAGGALTVIEQIQASLKALQSQGTFNINPILNTEGFAAAEAQLKRLAGLSAAVVAPFTPKDTKAQTGKPSSLVSALTKDEKTKLTNAQKQIKAWNEKIAPIQSRLDANRAIPEDQRTPAIKGQITRDTKTLAAYQANRAEQENIVRTLQGKSTAAAQTAAKTAKPLALDIVGNLSKINVTAKAPVVPIVGEITKIQNKVTEAIPVNVKISGEQIATSLKTITPTPVLDVKVHLMTEGIQQQLQALSGQTKPIVKTTPKAAAPATPTATPHPVYTPPTFTAAEEKQLNTLAAQAGTLSTAQEKAAKAMASAKAKLDKSGGSNRAFDRYMATQREYGGIRKEYLDVQKQLKPLMFKQFQSTAKRALTDEEIVKGIGAQNIVNQLAAKKRLNAAQKTQLAEANQTLAALRAPATPPTAPVATTPTPATTQPAKIKKAAAKNTITATVDTKNIVSQIQNIPRQTIPVAIKLMWERGAVGRQEQLKKITANIPPVTLNFETATAIAKLEEFVAKVRAASPQNIKLTATGVATNAAPATTVPPTQKAPTTVATPAKGKKTTAVGQKKPAVVDTTKGLTQTKLPSVALKLDTTAAVTALEEFVAKVRAASPQNIKLTATGVPPAGTQQNATAPATNPVSPVAPIVPPATGGTTQKGQKQSGHTGHQPLTPRQYRDQLGAHLAKGGMLPPNYATQIADQQRRRAWHLDQMKRDAIAAFAQKTPYELAEEERLRKLAPTTAGTGKNKVAWGSTAPAAHTAPNGYKWVRANDLTSYLTNEQQQQLAKLRGDESNARGNVARIQSQIARSTGKSNARLEAARIQYAAIQKQMEPYLKQMAQLEEMKKPLLSLKKPNKTQRSALARIESSQAALQTQIDQYRQAQAPFANAIQHETALMARYGTMSSNALSAATQQHSSARAAVSRYTDGWKLAQTNPKGKPSESNIQKAARLQAQAQNAMLPFAQSKEQLNMLTKHRRYFRQAVATTGIMPTPGMEAPQMLKYLQGVSTQMQKASVAVPWTLQSQINKLEGDVAKANGVGQPTQSRGTGMVPMRTGQPKPFFDRSRRWAYPFTGQTSFGVRTPMAVDMAKGMGVMFAIGGAMSAIGSSFSQAMEYQNTMRTTQAILQNGTDSYSQNSFKNMEATVRNVGVKTKFSAPEVASAARFLAMAGYDIDAINAAIRPIADLALIGDSDLGETADKMTNIMTTFQIAPDRMREAANIMATTATRSNTDLMMLAESAKYGGGVANMYGRNDPNLFADTMALFGVMGNAGIQASSAGTALRMMYQNLFKPNKNQKAVLDMMKQSYGITTLKEDGSYRSMSDILIEMAQRIPENQMASIVGNLFRITAQPGAAATLLAAADGDKGIAQEIGTGIEAMSNKMSSKAELSSLVSIMLANRNSIHGNISGAIAEEKQNTISGLWAQVTSTFTEGIVQAFENRQGGFEEMLKKLRDYLSKPETIQMMQNLLDMIIEIGKVMAWFVKIWASLYNAAPGLIKFWVTFQMGITQMGALIAPIISLIGVFDRLKGSILALAGISSVGGATMTRNVAGRVVAGSAANAAITNAPFIVGPGKWGTNKVIRGNIATRAHNALAANAILAGKLALSGTNKQTTLAALNKETRQHYAAVRERAMRMYGPARAGRAFRAAATAVPTMASFAPMFGGLKSMLMGLLTGLAKAAGFLVNPVTLAVGAVAGLGYGLYKLKQRIDGTSEAQQRARVQANKAADQTHRELTKEGQWYQDMMNENIPEAAPVISSIDTTQIEKYNADKQKFNQLYATIFNDFSKDASKQSINDVTTKWKNVITANPAYSLAIGNARNYDFSKKHKQMEYNLHNDASNLGIALWNIWHADEDTAINQRNGMVQDALMIEGANDLRTQQAIREIAELRQKYLAGETTYKSESEYQQAAFAIRDRFMSQFTAKLPSAGMTPEQFQQTSNRSVYDQYQLGAQNLLDATINGQMGTLVGKMNAYQWLSDTKNRAQLYTDEWYNAISNIIGDYHVLYDVISADGQQQARIELMLSTLPNGQLNFTNILDQIRAKVTNFNLTIQGFSDIIGTAYKMMAEAGIIDINDVKSLQSQIRHQLTGAKYGDETPRQYWAQWIAKNENSEWIKAGINEQQYVDFIMGRSGETLNLGNRVVTRSGEQQQMYSNISRKTAKTIIDQNKHLTEKAKQFGNNNSGTQNTPTPKPTPAPAQDQQAYASHYDRATARPTQVVFNINNLASFDRTTVASSAEERDLMAAMEDRIAGAVYQMFAEASNQAQRVMDLT
ncbi:phage tail tape measure protein [Duncaniella freteri]|uniref:phage tail tape measure protein n=1 Tax=Duncaniella freteri TaxID=2530391 RepID=UPI003F6617B9